jgi:hypothetical protein
VLGFFRYVPPSRSGWIKSRPAADHKFYIVGNCVQNLNKRHFHFLDSIWTSNCLLLWFQVKFFRILDHNFVHRVSVFTNIILLNTHQENVCVGNRMFLLFRISPELCTITQLQRPQDTSCLISFQALRWVLEPLADAKATKSTIFNKFKIEEKEKWRLLRETSLKLHYSSPEIHYPMVAFSVEPRLVCNVAQSIRYLRDQVNSQVADRLAIIANLCHFEKRLNTRELEGRSLSTCILVLALLNGDLSLFSGIYPSVWASRSLNATGKTWQLPASQALKEVYTPVLGGANIGQIYSLSLTDDGDLDVEGHLWEVDTKVDFTEIQQKYAGFNLHDEDEVNMMPIYRDIYWDILLYLNRKGYPGLVKAIWEMVRKTYVGAPVG